MKIDSNAIAALLKSQIEHFSSSIDENETGTVISVGDGIATIYGLNNVMLGELLLFPNDVYGMAMNLDEENVGAVLFGSDINIEEGDNVRCLAKRIMGVGSGFVISCQLFFACLSLCLLVSRFIPLFIPSSNNFYTSAPDIFIRAPSAEV